MTVLVVVQARMGSTRLPGKVLMDLGGQPLLAFMLGRLSALDGVGLVVATSDRPADDEIERCAAELGVQAVRGDEVDVLDRFRTALDAYPADHVVRLTADCPLIDADLVSEVIGVHLASRADYTSNTIIRTHPDGLDVEVISAEALRSAATAATDPAEREHVTPYVYRRPGRFRLAAVRHRERLGHLRWTVDTAEDLARLRDMVSSGPVAGSRAGSRTVSWTEMLDALPPGERVPLRHGFEPAIEAELHGIAPELLSLDDPAQRLVSFRVNDRSAGWLRIVVDEGEATISGSTPAEHLDAARAALPGFLAQSLQITSGDLSLNGVTT